MMPNASGITISGGTFTNVGGAILRPMASYVAATSQPDAPVNEDEDEDETIMTNMFPQMSNLTVTAGATAKIENIATQMMPGQRPRKGQNIQTTMFDGLKNSKFGGGVFTNASSVIYYPTGTSSSGMLPSDFTPPVVEVRQVPFPVPSLFQVWTFILYFSPFLFFFFFIRAYY